MTDIENRILNFFYNQDRQSRFSLKGNVTGCWSVYSEIVFSLDDKQSLIKNLREFGNSHEITSGVNIHDYNDIPNEHLKVHLDWQEEKFKELTSGNPPLESLTIPKSFNIIGKNIDNDLVIPTTAYRLGYYVHRMLNALGGDDSSKRNVVLEIGAGFGLTSLIFKRSMKNSCYVIIDIPTTSILSAYLLMSMGLKVCLYGEFNELNEKLINEYDVIILPPHYIEKFPEDSIDLVINTASFVEMNLEYIDYYLTNINKIAKKFYYDSHSVDLHTDKDICNLFLKKLKNFKLVFNQETPINYLQPRQKDDLFRTQMKYEEKLWEKM